jgi:hypothetical protein
MHRWGVPVRPSGGSADAYCDHHERKIWIGQPGRLNCVLNHGGQFGGDRPGDTERHRDRLALVGCQADPTGLQAATGQRQVNQHDWTPLRANDSRRRFESRGEGHLSRLPQMGRDFRQWSVWLGGERMHQELGGACEYIHETSRAPLARCHSVRG